MQMETKMNTVGYTVTTGSDQAIPVTGFSWLPTAVENVYITYGAADNQEKYFTSLKGAFQEEGTAGVELVINSVTFTGTQVDVSIRNGHSATSYIEQVIVTAIRTG